MKTFDEFVNESLNEAARIGHSKWNDVLKDLLNLGWDKEKKFAVKYFGDNNSKLRMTNSGGDDVKYEVLNNNDEIMSSGSFDAEGISAGELDGEVWNFIEDDDY
jgi:hypothetical protein